MISFKYISVIDLITNINDIELFLDIEDNSIKYVLFSDDDINIGYIGYDNDMYIHSFEIFNDFRGKGYSKIIMNMFRTNIANFGTIRLTPIKEELVSLYKKLGFKITNEYINHLALFPIMELEQKEYNIMNYDFVPVKKDDDIFKVDYKLNKIVAI